MSAVLKWHPQGMNDIHGSSRAITVRQEVACCKWVPASFMCSQATGEGTDGVVPSQAWPHGSDLTGVECQSSKRWTSGLQKESTDPFRSH